MALRLRALVTLLSALLFLCCTLFLTLETHHNAFTPIISPPVDPATWKAPPYDALHSVATHSTFRTEKNAAIAPEPTNSSSPVDKIKVPFPIFVASLPKSGTTSIARYFYCGNIWTAHTFVNTEDYRQMRIGECFQQNVQNKKPPFEKCGRYHVYSDAGYVRDKRCYYPSVHGLQALYDSYPNATILLVKRSSDAWLKSIQKWKKGFLLKKWTKCDKFPDKNASDNDVALFYQWHASNTRQFAASHPSITYIEILLEDDNNGTEIGKQLEEKIGINASCWGHHNSHEKRMRLNPRFRKAFIEDRLA